MVLKLYYPYIPFA